MPRGVPVGIIERLQEAIAAGVGDPAPYLNASRDELQGCHLPGREWARSMQERKAGCGEIMKRLGRKTDLHDRL